MKKTYTLLALCAIAVASAVAQDGPKPPQGGRPEGNRPPPPPLMRALDANQDGVIDATEIANASAALSKLDKNGDGQLTMEELRPPMPPGGHPGGDRPNEGGNQNKPRPNYPAPNK